MRESRVLLPDEASSYCDARPVDWVGTCHNDSPVEISVVRNRLNRAIEASRERSQRRRQRTAAAESAFELFLQNVATPVTNSWPTA